MGSASNNLHEYLCPSCGNINSITQDEALDFYTEHAKLCAYCGQGLEVTPANGINNQINIVVALALPPLPSMR
jgi:hypothetical protein